jgi:heptosyltransferase-1
MLEQRFLVVRLSSLGDVVHTFPAVAGLRESYPHAEIVWLTHPRWKPLVESSSLATDIWAAETRSFASLREILRRIRARGFETAIDYQGLWKSAAFSFLGGVPRRIGFSSETIREYGVPILYTDRVRTTQPHIADQNGELSQRAGARHATGTVKLSVPPEEESKFLEQLRGLGVDRYVVLSPGGGWLSKCWPPERFGVLCKMIRDSLGLRCIINHGPGEESLALAVRNASADAAPILYNPELGQLMVLLRNALCIVGGDSGPLHLAVTLGTSSVALFGPTDPARNGPYRSGSCANTVPIDVVLRSPHAVTNYKRGTQVDPSMLEIEADTVFESVRRLVETRS